MTVKVLYQKVVPLDTLSLPHDLTTSSPGPYRNDGWEVPRGFRIVQIVMREGYDEAILFLEREEESAEEIYKRSQTRAFVAKTGPV